MLDLPTLFFYNPSMSTAYPSFPAIPTPDVPYSSPFAVSSYPLIISETEIDKIAARVAAKILVGVNPNPGPCLICSKEIAGGTTMPYGSQFDGEYLCPECMTTCMDPIINLVKGL